MENGLIPRNTPSSFAALLVVALVLRPRKVKQASFIVRKSSDRKIIL